jgi:hypothetical protein
MNRPLQSASAIHPTVLRLTRLLEQDGQGHRVVTAAEIRTWIARHQVQQTADCLVRHARQFAASFA